jgi:diacylglycerol kinase family enzyme
MDLEYFAESIAEICAHSPLAPGRPLRWIIIANPGAGGFTIKRRWKKHRQILEEYRAKAQANPPRSGSGPADTARQFDPDGVPGGFGLIPTIGPGHGKKIAAAFVDEAQAALGGAAMGEGASGKGSRAGLGRAGPGQPSPFYLIITAGGDGTSLEALSELYHASALVRSNMAALRLPMGTGNDGADAAELEDALDLLIKPVNIVYTRALRLITSPIGPAQSRGPFLAFNILSVGLDAFVTHMTNKMKGNLPGDSYKLWVDIASLLYDRLYTVGFLEVRVLDEKKQELRSFREKILLLAVGASGRRTYGSHKKILPDDRNVCAVKQMSLFRKVALKGQFTTGTHIDKPESMLFSAHRVEFSGAWPILAQMDGETVLLQKEDFPAAIELTEPCIQILKPFAS